MSWRKVGEASPLCTLGTEQTETVRLRRRAIVSSVPLKVKADRMRSCTSGRARFESVGHAAPGAQECIYRE
jgi:hypothetical protein